MHVPSRTFVARFYAIKNLKQNFESLFLSIITTGFLIWSGLFIYRSSFIAIDGQRYFSLFDDAMISMRYAWNLAHGQGLVWNPGEYVEGYTNLLMVLLMSLAAFIFDDKRLAVLAVQVAGVLFMLGIAYITMHIADAISEGVSGESPLLHSAFRILAFFCTLAYYPLTYWTLMGMETGLVTLLLLFSLWMALRYAKQLNQRHLVLMSLALGLAYLTRPDTLVLATILWIYVFYHSIQSRKIGLFIAFAGLYVCFPVMQTIFRWAYYGELAPNTYTLKIVGIPLVHRLRNGLIFIRPFLSTNVAILVIVMLGLLSDFRRQKVLLMTLIFAALGYQIWAGGDPWPYWRMMAPVMPLLLLLLSYELLLLMKVFTETSFFSTYISQNPVLSRQTIQLIFTITLVLVFLLQSNRAFVREIFMVDSAYKVQAHLDSLNDAIAIQQATTSEATIAVFEAGVIPYYSGRFAIDILGKVDKHVARVSPDLARPNWFGMRGVVGHNKYDLNYSIKEREPTFVQTFDWGQFAWGMESISDWGKEAYTKTSYEGVPVYFLKDSDAVLWERLLIDKEE